MNISWKKHPMMQFGADMINICFPLKELGVDGFFFMRFFNNGNFIDLSTDLKWTDHFFTRYFAEEYNFSTVQNHLAFDLNVDLWSLDQGNEFYHDAKQNFNIKDGISITYQHKKYRDVFCFYIKNTNKLQSRHLISQLNLFKNFSEYFLYQACDLITDSEKQPLIMPKKYQEIFLTPIDQHYTTNYSLAKNFLARGSEVHLDGFKVLSSQEKKCIYFASHGYSAGEIALNMNLSKRTVESYLNNARNKTGCRNIVELVSRYYCLHQI